MEWESFDQVVVWQWLPTGFGLRSVRIVRGITDGVVPLHGILGLPGSVGRSVSSHGMGAEGTTGTSRNSFLISAVLARSSQPRNLSPSISRAVGPAATQPHGFHHLDISHQLISRETFVVLNALSQSSGRGTRQYRSMSVSSPYWFVSCSGLVYLLLISV